MCGIFGVITEKETGLYQDEENFLETMLIAGAVRGMHGTGTMWVSHKDKGLARTLKCAGDPYNLIYDKFWDPYWKQAKVEGKFFVGHHRYATKGARTTANAHPFNSQHITMVHNGTINWGLSEYNKGIEVDSEALTIGLATEGIDIFSKVSGAYACVWHNANDHTLNIAKNTERPLSLFKSEGKYFFASEEAMLYWAMYRSKPDRNVEKLLLIPGHHYKFNLDNLGAPEVSPLPEKKYTPPATTGGKIYHGGKLSGTNEETTTETKKTRNQEQVATFTIKKKLIEHKNGVPLYTYLGFSDRAEAVYFLSGRDFVPDEKVEYEGEIVEGAVGVWATHLGTEKTLWYKLKSGSVKLKDSNPVVVIKNKTYPMDAIDEAVANDCFLCGIHINHTELNDCEIISISPNKYRCLCPLCSFPNPTTQRALLQ